MVVRDANNYSYIHIYIVNTYNWINRQSTYNIDLYIFSLNKQTNYQTLWAKHLDLSWHAHILYSTFLWNRSINTQLSWAFTISTPPRHCFSFTCWSSKRKSSFTQATQRLFSPVGSGLTSVVPHLPEAQSPLLKQHPPTWLPAPTKHPHLANAGKQPVLPGHPLPATVLHWYKRETR